MDLVISGTESSLLESLSFDLPPSSSYVQQRRLVSFYPSGASTFSPNGVRVCNFTIAGDGWLDPASLRVVGSLRNGHATTSLQLADGPHSMISRMRLFIGGTLCEDCDFYSRSHQLFRRMLMGSEWVKNDAIESGLQTYNPASTGTLPRGSISPLARVSSGTSSHCSEHFLVENTSLCGFPGECVSKLLSPTRATPL